VPDIKDGYIYPPEKPGIGVEIDEKEALKHPFAGGAPVQWFHSDGSVADW
jgi:galactonate dehydratase